MFLNYLKFYLKRQTSETKRAVNLDQTHCEGFLKQWNLLKRKTGNKYFELEDCFI